MQRRLLRDLILTGILLIAEGKLLLMLKEGKKKKDEDLREK